MRAAAFVAAALIVAGIYLAIAATVGFASTWIALGMLVIAGLTSVSLVVARPSQPR
jgi:hypothetical protein